MWKGRVGSLMAPCDRRRKDGSKLTSCLESLEIPCDHLDRKLYSWQTRLACELLVFRVHGSLPRDSFFFPPTPYGIASLPLSEGLDPGERTDVVLANEFFFAFAIHPLSLSRFLPRMFLLTTYSPDRERKSWELNECRVPLEGSLSMPTRETPVLAS